MFLRIYFNDFMYSNTFCPMYEHWACYIWHYYMWVYRGIIKWAMAIAFWNTCSHVRYVHNATESWGFTWTGSTCLFIYSDAFRDRSQRSHLNSILSQVYRSLEYELQKHVSSQDTLQQCQAWISAVQPDLKPSPQPPLSRAEAVKQVVESGKFYY